MTAGITQPASGVVLIVDDDKPFAGYVATVMAEATYTPVVATLAAGAGAGAGGCAPGFDVISFEETSPCRPSP